jgi:archaemetzincin
MKKKLLFILLAVLMLGGCKKTENANCTCPPTIFLQPYDNYTQKEAKQLSKVLEKKFLELYGVEFEFEVLPNKKLSADLMNDSKSRFRADKIIDSLKKEASDHRIMIGLTHKDVSVPYKGKPDWGVLGLSIHGTYACVVSDYRLKNKKRDYWKVVTHEFTHTACNYSHCPDDDPTCIMKDAKGKADFSNKVGFCRTCREKINI